MCDYFKMGTMQMLIFSADLHLTQDGPYSDLSNTNVNQK